MRRLAAGPLLKLLFRPWVKGLENVPETGGAILASNHLSFSDSVFLPIVLKREIVFLGKAEYFSGKGIKGRLTAFFMRGIGTIPVDRSGGRAAEAALNAGLARLNEGGLFGIYPEGTRSPDGRMYRGKTGVARLAIESGAPVLPVVMVGTDKVQPIGQRIPKIKRVGVIIGEPLDFSRYEGMSGDRFVLREVTDEIVYALQSLSGQEYVDMYAQAMKTRIAAGAKDPEAVQASADFGAGGRPTPQAVLDARVEREAEKAKEAAKAKKASSSDDSIPSDDESAGPTDALPDGE